MGAKQLKEKAKKLREKAAKLTKEADAANCAGDDDAGDKKAMAVKADAAAKQAEKEAKQAETKEAGDEGADKSADAGGDDEGEEHDDADQDKALIQKMLDEYVGDAKGEEREALEKLAHEAYQAHKEMGHKEKEAMEKTKDAVSLARHMASKQTEAEAVEAEAETESEAETVESEAESETESHVESRGGRKSKRETDLESKLLEAQGKLAALEAKAKKGDLHSHVEKTLRESGQPNVITKRFREAAGDFKSIKDFDSKWKIFLEGVKNTGTVELDWTPIAEKSTLRESEVGKVRGEGSLDFSVCADED